MEGTCTIIRKKGSDWDLIVNDVIEAEFERMKKAKNEEIERVKAKNRKLIGEKYAARFADYEAGFASLDDHSNDPGTLNQIAGGILMIAEDALMGIVWAVQDILDFMIHFPRSCKRYVSCIRRNIRKLGWKHLPGILRFATRKWLVDLKFIREY